MHETFFFASLYWCGLLRGQSAGTRISGWFCGSVFSSLAGTRFEGCLFSPFCLYTVSFLFSPVGFLCLFYCCTWFRPLLSPRIFLAPRCFHSQSQSLPGFLH
uniref:Uncharacterized protein n=1 Tax=Cacopsylla melanoneura TaxID=428564 RepID=A0A8D8UIZ2_9HEMI